MSKISSSVENGSTVASQQDLFKLLAGANPLVNPSLGALGNLGTLTASAAHQRQNGNAMMRPFDSLMQNPTSRLPPQSAVTSIPGPTRRRKKKRRRQPDMPKKACTPFMHFCSYFKKKLMEEGKEFPQFADFGKRAGELWRNMPDTEKVQFNELSEQDRQRYIRDMKEYEERKLAEKEREQELQQQRDKELQVLREKEIERLQKQQRDQLEQQQKQMEQHQKHHLDQQVPSIAPQMPNQANASLLNMLTPLNPLQQLLMAAALNQQVMQSVMSNNPELLKNVYAEAAKNYYLESMKYYQPPYTQANGCSVSSASTTNTLSSYSPPADIHLNTNHLNSIGINLNLLSLMNSSQFGGSQPMSPTNGSASPPAGKSPTLTKVSGSSPIGTPNSGASTALDLSARLDRSACSSDEEGVNQVDECEIQA